GSMQRAIDETERRRAKQVAFNTEHGITPTGLNKKIADIMEGAVASGARGRSERAAGRKVAERPGRYVTGSVDAAGKTAAELLKDIQRLEDDMYKAASELAFERAAQLRDEIATLKNLALQL
ncbi:MAG: UvrB/UvrC motif-containing protein, partial [Gammaproteobacteria bacterium]|nr:UvrB/UvrC motif-containing protein [Gammaproteobacteria bacterium]